LVDFYQEGPSLGNQYDCDRLLDSYLKRVLPAKLYSQCLPEYQRFGALAADEWFALAEQAENEPPRHIPYDPWGRRIDRIDVSDAWKKFDQISAREGLVAIGYERKSGAFSRLDQFVRLFLFAPSSAISTCPLAMTDGAARVLELYGSDDQKTHVLPHLISRDPKFFWTSGQWMTERTGGSDVGGTSTIARLENGQYRLYGTKWFTSATTSQLAITLARPEGAQEGSRGLSLFCIQLRDEQGSLRNIQVNRLKDKLGTRALPTAELTLEGTPAEPVGELGNGVKKISSLFNITRIYNACCSVAGLRRAIVLATDYARKRRAFGRPLSEHPLHVETLAGLQVEYEGCFHLAFRAVELLGRCEAGEGSDEDAKLLRLLTPVVKLFTAKIGVIATSEVLELFGGAGYIEDTGIPKLLRDAQVLAIWEGTTNVLSLDLLRAIEKEGVLPVFFNEVDTRLAKITRQELNASVQAVREALALLQHHAQSIPESRARSYAFGVARVYAATLLLEHATFTRETETAKRYCNSGKLVDFVEEGPSEFKNSCAILGL
jgi:alkylation response protein AidB-like acyl-CoA dehydrogenase